MVSILAVLSTTLGTGRGDRIPSIGQRTGGIVTDAPPIPDTVPVPDTWGISGPDFLWLFGAAVLASVALAVAVRALVDSRRDRRVRGPHDLSPTELAYLSGGPSLVASVSLWSLVRSDVLEVRNRLVDATRARWTLEPGDLDRAADATELAVLRVPPDLDDVDSALVELVQRSSGARPASIRLALERSEAMVAVGDDLTARGLLRSPGTRRRMRLAVVACFAPVLVLGAARLVAGVANTKPVADLLVLLSGAVMAFVVVLHVPTVPWRISRLLASARGHAERTLPPVLRSMDAPQPHADEARAVALLGTGVFTMGAVDLAPLLAMPTTTSIIGRHEGGGGCGGGGGGGGGGSCGSGGGGGCGGGGCGG